MTREESWEVERVTLRLLRHVTSLGYTVSVFAAPLDLRVSSPGSFNVKLKAKGDLSLTPAQLDKLLHGVARTPVTT
jgi:hypothetical protein